MGKEDDVCVDCTNAKEVAQKKSEASRAANDGLRLGECAPLYRDWAACVEENAGQAKACAAALDLFKLCHAQLASVPQGNQKSR